ncbi:MAK10-like protein, partial [Tanacetum coccineum]
QARNWLERLPVGSISTWEDLTTRFLAQFFRPGRTAKFRNDILMFQQHKGESLSETWTRFKDLLQKTLIMTSIFGFKSKSFMTMLIPSQDEPLINRPVAISLPQDVPSISDRHLVELEFQVQCLMDNYLAPEQTNHVNKIASSCEICGGPHNTQYCMEDLEQTSVEYASAYINETNKRPFISSKGTQTFNEATHAWKDKPNFDWARTQILNALGNKFSERFENSPSLNDLATSVAHVNVVISDSVETRTSPCKSAIKCPSKMLSSKYQASPSLKTNNERSSSPKRVYFVNAITIVDKDDESREAQQIESDNKEMAPGNEVELNKGKEAMSSDQSEIEEPLDMVDTCKELVYESLIRDIPSYLQKLELLDQAYAIQFYSEKKIKDDVDVEAFINKASFLGSNSQHEVLNLHWNSVYIFHSSMCGECRSLFDCKPIKAGECMLKVPHSVKLTQDSLPPKVSSLLRKDVSNRTKLALVILLHQKLGQASEWDPYMSSLPPDWNALTVVLISLGRTLFNALPLLPITHGMKCNVIETFKVYAEICVRSLSALCTLQMSSLKDEESPKGSLLFSFTIEREDSRVVPLVQYVVCLAMAEAIKDLALRNGIRPLNVRIKWPNYLYLDGLKVEMPIRKSESPKGSLLFSFTIERDDSRVVPLVQYVVCLAMTEAIKDLALRNVRLSVSSSFMIKVDISYGTNCLT